MRTASLCAFACRRKGGGGGVGRPQRLHADLLHFRPGRLLLLQPFLIVAVLGGVVFFFCCLFSWLQR